MNPTTVGILAAAAIIVAFVAGAMIDFDDGQIELQSPIASEGPLEKVGEALDDAAKQ